MQVVHERSLSLKYGTWANQTVPPFPIVLTEREYKD